MAVAYLLGGRAYRSAATQTTIQQDAYLMAFVRRHKLSKLIDDGGDLVAAVLATGEPGEFASGLLVEDGKTWSVEDARANAKSFNALTDDESKGQFCEALGVLLAGFFPLGRSSVAASPTFSDPVASRRRKPQRRRAVTPTTDTASGPASSPPSPPTTEHAST